MGKFIQSFPLVCFLVAFPAAAFAQSEIGRAANVMTISEALLAETALVSEHFAESADNFTWSANYAERHWVATMNGMMKNQESLLTMTGFLWGDDGESMTVSYSGMGQIGGEPVLVHGQASWLYDPETEDYQAMDFQHVTRIGENSIWGWVLGAEIVVGGAVGGVVAVGGSSAVTGGLALGAAPWIAAGGAAGGVATFITISTGTKELLEADSAPPPPTPPERPQLPKEGEDIGPSAGRIVVAMTDEGRLTGSAVDGTHVLEGTYSLSEGFAEGIIFPGK